MMPTRRLTWRGREYRSPLRPDQSPLFHHGIQQPHRRLPLVASEAELAQEISGGKGTAGLLFEEFQDVRS